jgi:hypothetical protein
VDLLKLFQKLDENRSFNIIDDILVEEALRNAEVEESLTKMRKHLDKSYLMVDDENPLYKDIEGYIPGDYAEATDQGFMGIAISPMQ